MAHAMRVFFIIGTSGSMEAAKDMLKEVNKAQGKSGGVLGDLFGKKK
jgi:hypothetical protein